MEQARTSLTVRQKAIAVGCAIVALLAIVALVGACGANTDNEPPKLSALVFPLEGAQLEIQNLDDFDWTDVTLILNSDYRTTTSIMEANTTYTVGLATFTKSDGTRFNPWTQTVLNILIRSNEGSYYGGPS